MKYKFLKQKITFCIISFILFSFIFKNKIFTNNQTNIAHAKPTLTGYIQIPQDWQFVPKFRFFYNGYETTNNDKGLYSFPLNKNLNKINLLICKNVKPLFDKINTIKNVKIIIDKSYKYFCLKKIDEKNDIWHIKEKKRKTKNFVIPKNCVIALINPKYVKGIKAWQIKPLNNFTKLPKIVLKENIKENKLKREAIKSLLRTLELTTFHQKTTNDQKSFPNGIKISLTQ